MQLHEHALSASQAAEPSTETSAPPERSDWRALLACRDALVAAAAATGLMQLELKYSGSNDEGITEEILGTPEDVELDELYVDAWTADLRWQPEGGSQYVMTPARRPIGDVLETMTDLALSISGHGGFEVGHGGHGTLSLDLASGELTLEHHVCHLASRMSFYDFSDMDGDHSQDDTPVLDEDGIPVRKLSFGGCGGAGDDC